MPRPINQKTPLGRFRGSAEISVEQLALWSGVSVSAIQKIEQGIYDPSIATAKKLACWLPCHWADLVDQKKIDELVEDYQSLIPLRVPINFDAPSPLHPQTLP